MTGINESILYQELPENNKRIVDTCSKYLQDLWSEHRLITYYTDYGYKHSVRVLTRIEELLSFGRAETNSNLLNSQEKFLLILSVLFHDIGMQCDLSKNPLIIEIVKEVYGVDFQSDFRGKYT